MPTWYFQEKLPVRYTELATEVPEVFYFRVQLQTSQPFSKHTTNTNSRTFGTGSDTHTFNLEGELRAMSNVHSLPDEPFMSSFNDNVQCIIFQLVSIRPLGGFVRNYSDSWAKVGGILNDDEDFGMQLKRSLKNEDEIIAKAKTLKSDDEKIAYIF